MKSDKVALAAIGILTLFALGAAWIVPSHADRLYPTLDLRYRVQESQAPQLRAGPGLALSLGRFAPSIKTSVGLNGKLSPGFDATLSYKF